MVRLQRQAAQWNFAFDFRKTQNMQDITQNCNVPHQPEEAEESEDDEIIDGSE